MICAFRGGINGLDTRKLETSRTRKTSKGNYWYVRERINRSDARKSQRMDYVD